MHVAMRNHLAISETYPNGVILWWVDGVSARAYLSNGPGEIAAKLSATERTGHELQCISAAISRVQHLSARRYGVWRSAAYRKGITHVADACDHDILTGDYRPNWAVASEEQLGEAIREIEQHWLDRVNNPDFPQHCCHTLEEVREVIRQQYESWQAWSPMCMGLRGWWGKDAEIDDQPGYALEDGRRFATAAEAQRADDAAARGQRLARYRANRDRSRQQLQAAGLADELGRVSPGQQRNIPGIGSVETTGRVPRGSAMIEVRFPTVPRRPPQCIGVSYFLD